MHVCRSHECTCVCGCVGHMNAHVYVQLYRSYECICVYRYVGHMSAHVCVQVCSSQVNFGHLPISLSYFLCQSPMNPGSLFILSRLVTMEPCGTACL